MIVAQDASLPDFELAALQRRQSRNRKASMLHLLDLKRAGHEPGRTERAWPVRYPLINLDQAPLAIQKGPDRPQVEPFTGPLPQQWDAWYDAHVRAWRRHYSGLTTRNPPVSLIIAAASRRFGVGVDEITSKRRFARIVMPRQIAMFLSREMTAQSWHEISARFGGRDHTTCLYAHAKYSRLQSEPRIASHIQAIRADVVANFTRQSERSIA